MAFLQNATPTQVAHYYLSPTPGGRFPRWEMVPAREMYRIFSELLKTDLPIQLDQGILDAMPEIRRRMHETDIHIHSSKP